ncbi:hypothetical protein B0H13DRAFT_1898164 [Mycena leptocephala]|nr:hypothetical protein B0H13DRAFT_1898164 [Mycena leptocephala]
MQRQPDSIALQSSGQVLQCTMATTAVIGFTTSHYSHYSKNQGLLMLVLALCESSGFALDFLPAALEEVEDASVVAVHCSCRGPSVPSQLGLRTSVKSCCCRQCLLLEFKLEECVEGGGVDAEKCCSEHSGEAGGTASAGGRGGGSGIRGAGGVVTVVVVVAGNFTTKPKCEIFTQEV